MGTTDRPGRADLLAHLPRANRSPAPLPRPPSLHMPSAKGRPEPGHSPLEQQAPGTAGGAGCNLASAPDDRRGQSWPSLSHQKLLPEGHPVWCGLNSPGRGCSQTQLKSGLLIAGQGNVRMRVHKHT